MHNPVNAKAAILVALLKGGEDTALGIIDSVEKMTNGGIALRRGNVYPALSSLHLSEMVKCKERKSNATNRNRQLWSLTSKGRREAERQQAAVLSLYAKDK